MSFQTVESGAFARQVHRRSQEHFGPRKKPRTLLEKGPGAKVLNCISMVEMDEFVPATLMATIQYDQRARLLAAVFEKCVFVNCPFDEEFEPILQAILFCLVYLGFEPRLATEKQDGGENRLTKIIGLIEGSKYSIHDLSRCQARKKGEHFRLNMPFELGLDYGAREFKGGKFKDKSILILEEQRYRYQAAISDLAGCDIEAHGADYQKAIRKVRNWLRSEALGDAPGAALIFGKYVDFQEWYYESQLADGFSDEDIQDYPTSELLDAMIEWKKIDELV